MQVGIIDEMIGNGAEAETSLQWGKAISCKLKLPLFMVAFSLILGILTSPPSIGKILILAWSQ